MGIITAILQLSQLLWVLSFFMGAQGDVLLLTYLLFQWEKKIVTQKWLFQLSAIPPYQPTTSWTSLIHPKSVVKHFFFYLFDDLLAKVVKVTLPSDHQSLCCATMNCEEQILKLLAERPHSVALTAFPKCFRVAFLHLHSFNERTRKTWSVQLRSFVSSVAILATLVHARLRDF